MPVGSALLKELFAALQAAIPLDAQHTLRQPVSSTAASGHRLTCSVESPKQQPACSAGGRVQQPMLCADQPLYCAEQPLQQPMCCAEQSVQQPVCYVQQPVQKPSRERVSAHLKTQTDGGLRQHVRCSEEEQSDCSAGSGPALVQPTTSSGVQTESGSQPTRLDQESIQLATGEGEQSKPLVTHNGAQPVQLQASLHHQPPGLQTVLGYRALLQHTVTAASSSVHQAMNTSSCAPTAAAAAGLAWQGASEHISHLPALASTLAGGALMPIPQTLDPTPEILPARSKYRAAEGRPPAQAMQMHQTALDAVRVTAVIPVQQSMVHSVDCSSSRGCPSRREASSGSSDPEYVTNLA